MRVEHLPQVIEVSGIEDLERTLPLRRHGRVGPRQHGLHEKAIPGVTHEPDGTEKRGEEDEADAGANAGSVPYAGVSVRYGSLRMPCCPPTSCRTPTRAAAPSATVASTTEGQNPASAREVPMAKDALPS